MPRSSRKPTDADRAIAARIRALREAAGLTQADLAQAIGKTAQAIGSYETGRSRVSGVTLVRLAERLGVTLAHLSGDDGAPAQVEAGAVALLAPEGAVEMITLYAQAPPRLRADLLRLVRLVAEMSRSDDVPTSGAAARPSRPAPARP